MLAGLGGLQEDKHGACVVFSHVLLVEAAGLPLSGVEQQAFLVVD
jgi:hypothetical protein